MTTYTAPPNPSRARRRGGLLRACATAAALVTAGLAFPAAGSAATDDVDAARAALPEPAGITHVRMKIHYGATNGAPAHPLSGRVAAHLPPAFGAAEDEEYPTTTGEVERWIAPAPLRDRTAWFHRWPDGRIGTSERSYADGEFREWNSDDRVLHVIPLSDAQRAEYENDRLGTQREWLVNVAWGADPVAGVRAMFDGGMLRSTGRITHEGRSVLRLVGEVPGTEQNGSPGGPITYEYLVDPTSFAPVRALETKTVRAPDEHGQGAERYVLGWSFSVYEHLPLNASTEHLLVAGSES